MLKVFSIGLAGLAIFILGFWYLIASWMWLILLLLSLWVIFVSWDLMVHGFPGDHRGRWDGPSSNWGWHLLNIVFGIIVAGVATRAAIIPVSAAWFIILGLLILVCAAIVSERPERV